MAWVSKEEEALDIITQHMRVMDEDKKEELNDLYTCLIFFRQSSTWDDINQTTLWGITFVTIWSHDHLLWNIWLAMIQEQMMTRWQKYCIINKWMPNFESKLLLLIKQLPYQKMRFFTPQFALDGPFLHSPQTKIGDAMCRFVICLRTLLIYTLYYSQQFQTFL